MWNFVLCFCVWLLASCLIHYFIPSNSKIVRNYISTIHATIILISFLLKIPEHYVYYVTATYYAFDGVIELYSSVSQKRLYNLLMVFHHAISIYVLSYLQNPLISNQIYYSFCMVEISNFPIYLAYHLKSKGYKLTRPLILCEIISFVFFRINIGGRCALDLAYDPNTPYLVIGSSVVLLLMSSLWIYGMWMQFINLT